MGLAHLRAQLAPPPPHRRRPAPCGRAGSIRRAGASTSAKASGKKTGHKRGGAGGEDLLRAATTNLKRKQQVGEGRLHSSGRGQRAPRVCWPRAPEPRAGFEQAIRRVSVAAVVCCCCCGVRLLAGVHCVSAGQDGWQPAAGSKCFCVPSVAVAGVPCVQARWPKLTAEGLFQRHCQLLPGDPFQPIPCTSPPPFALFPPAVQAAGAAPAAAGGGGSQAAAQQAAAAAAAAADFEARELVSGELRKWVQEEAVKREGAKQAALNFLTGAAGSRLGAGGCG